jgi:hypothetical protein
VEEFEEDLLEPFPLDGMVLPRIRLTLGEDVPYYQIKVGPQAYEYVKSYPIKGHSATLPKYVREQMNAGRKALIIERPTRFLVYLDIAG